MNAQPAATAKTKFVVIDENTFCYVNPRQPSIGWIMASKPLKGATLSWQDGAHPRPVNAPEVRPATVADFADYRVRLQDYQMDPENYELPAA